MTPIWSFFININWKSNSGSQNWQYKSNSNDRTFVGVVLVSPKFQELLIGHIKRLRSEFMLYFIGLRKDSDWTLTDSYSVWGIQEISLRAQQNPADSANRKRSRKNRLRQTYTELYKIAESPKIYFRVRSESPGVRLSLRSMLDPKWNFGSPFGVPSSLTLGICPTYSEWSPLELTSLWTLAH